MFACQHNHDSSGTRNRPHPRWSAHVLKSLRRIDALRACRRCSKSEDRECARGRRRGLWCWVLLAIVCCSSVLRAQGVPESAPVQSHIRSAVLGPSHTSATDVGMKPGLRQVYEARDYAPLWIGSGAAAAQAQSALALLEAAPRHGLMPKDYDVEGLALQVRRAAAAETDTAAIAAADVRLTDSLLRYLHDLHCGRVAPALADFHYAGCGDRFEPASALREAIAAADLPSAVTHVEPSFPPYVRLLGVLQRYRELSAGPWPALPETSAKLEAGASFAYAPALRARLRVLGDLASAEDVSELHYDAALAQAVRRFQERHGLAADGVLGRETIRALNVTPADRVHQISLALERMRWLPDFGGRPIVAINVPSFRLWAIDGGGISRGPALTMPVVVGRAVTATRTPIFIGEMRSIEFSPYWNVPSSIQHQEIVPRLARDPGYLQREGMELIDGRGGVRTSVDERALSDLRAGRLRVRQRPGSKNALGAAKFVLPNTMNIYLHGTAAQSLFSRSRRDFSHGCVRVADPAALAAFLLRDQPQWTHDRIENAMQSGELTRATLSSPVPVVIFYTTAFATNDGRALFLPDIYGFDSKLELALLKAGRALE